MKKSRTMQGTSDMYVSVRCSPLPIVYDVTGAWDNGAPCALVIVCAPYIDSIMYLLR